MLCEERQNSPSLVFVKRKAQNAVVLSLEFAGGMVKTTLKQLGKQFNSFYIASDLYLNILERLEHRATTSTGKPVSVLRGIAEKMSLFLRSWKLAQDLFILLDFRTDSQRMCDSFYSMFLPILLCFILCLVLKFRSGKPS